MPINKKELTKEQIQKAMACKTAEELMALAKAEGYELTRDEAAAYLDELQDMELDAAELKKAAGADATWIATTILVLCINGRAKPQGVRSFLAVPHTMRGMQTIRLHAPYFMFHHGKIFGKRQFQGALIVSISRGS